MCASEIDILLKFADDTKLGNKVETVEDCRKFQDCLKKLVIWADTWSMSFNITKCKVIHTGRANQNFVYTLNGVALEVATKEQDIEVTITSNLEHPAQRALQNPPDALMPSVNRYPGPSCIGIKGYSYNFTNSSFGATLNFQYHPGLPDYLGDIEILERVQKRAVHFIVGLKSKDYADRLNKLG